MPAFRSFVIEDDLKLRLPSQTADMAHLIAASLGVPIKEPVTIALQKLSRISFIQGFLVAVSAEPCPEITVSLLGSVDDTWYRVVLDAEDSIKAVQAILRAKYPTIRLRMESLDMNNMSMEEYVSWRNTSYRLVLESIKTLQDFEVTFPALVVLGIPDEVKGDCSDEAN